MTDPTSPNLLWVNKDATNLNSKKHVAEVNAHVQRKGSRRNASGSASRSTSVSSLRRADKNRRRSSQTPPIIRKDSNVDPPVIFALTADGQQAASHTTDRDDHSLYTLHQKLHDTKESVDYDARSLPIIVQMAHVQEHVANMPLDAFDIANQPHATVPGLSDHDGMLIQTYLTYLPQLPQALFDPDCHSVYCPLRSVSVVNMTRDPLGLLWVLISLDMFLAKTQSRDECDARVLQRKNQAYKLMAMRLDTPHDPRSLGFIIGTGSAGLAELFFGDPVKGVMHLNAVETVLQSNGGYRAITDLPRTITIPLLGAFAYRTLLRDSLGSSGEFTAAHGELMETMRSLLKHSKIIVDESINSPKQAVVFRNDQDVSDFDPRSSSSLDRIKQQVFGRGSLMHKFIHSDFHYTKPRDKVDHFVLLYSLNIALRDFGHDYHSAARYLEAVAEDVESTDSTRVDNPGPNISDIRCIIISHHAHAFARKGSEGVARAWGAVNALEILKYVSSKSRSKIVQTLSGLLTSQQNAVMSAADLETIDAEASTHWCEANGTKRSPPSG